MGNLQKRVKKLEEAVGHRERKVHVIITLGKEETNEQAKARFVDENHGTQLHDEDTIIFIVPVSGAPELERTRRGPRAATTPAGNGSGQSAKVELAS